MSTHQSSLAEYARYLFLSELYERFNPSDKLDLQRRASNEWKRKALLVLASEKWGAADAEFQSSNGSAILTNVTA
jgi:hypothetical protein